MTRFDVIMIAGLALSVVGIIWLFCSFYFSPNEEDVWPNDE